MSQNKLTHLQHKATCVLIHEQQAGSYLSKVLTVIGGDGIHDLWVEAGGQLFQLLHAHQLVNETLVYLSPKILGVKAKAAFNKAGDVLAGAYKRVWSVHGEDVMCGIQWS